MISSLGGVKSQIVPSWSCAKDWGGFELAKWRALRWSLRGRAWRLCACVSVRVMFECVLVCPCVMCTVFVCSYVRDRYLDTYLWAPGAMCECGMCALPAYNHFFTCTQFSKFIEEVWITLSIMWSRENIPNLVFDSTW